jgi:hypothetical protein
MDMMARRHLIAVLAVATLAACGGGPAGPATSTPTTAPGDTITTSAQTATTTSLALGGTVTEDDEVIEEQMTLVLQQAIADLADRLGVAEDEIKTESVASGIWSDASLGCPDPGEMYAQVITPGVRVILSHDGNTYSYHQGGSVEVFLCEDPDEDSFRGVEGDVLIPPPGYDE